MPPVFFPFSQGFIPFTAKQFRDDFAAPSNAFHNYWDFATGGTASLALGTEVANALGRATLSATAAATSSFARLYANYGVVVPNPAFSLWQGDILIPTLSTGTERFIIQAGFIEIPLVNTGFFSLPSNGFGFRYSDNINSGKWECYSVAAGVSTLIDSAVLAVAGTATRFRIIIPAAAGPVIFMVNDRLVGAIGTNIPLGLVQITQFSIAKLVGATARTCTVDYSGFAYMRSDIAPNDNV